METILGLPVWALWMIAGLILLIMELISTGFLMVCFGASALVTSILVYIFDFSLSAQLISFGIFSVLALLLLRPLMIKWLHREPVKSCIDALVGRELVMEQDFDTNVRYVEQKIAGDVWRVRSANGEAIVKGSKVKIVAREGLVLLLENIENINN